MTAMASGAFWMPLYKETAWRGHPVETSLRHLHGASLALTLALTLTLTLALTLAPELRSSRRRRLHPPSLVSCLASA